MWNVHNVKMNETYSSTGPYGGVFKRYIRTLLDKRNAVSNCEPRSVRFKPSKVTCYESHTVLYEWKFSLYLSHQVHSFSLHRTTGDVYKIGIPLSLTTSNRQYAERQTVWGLRPELLVFVCFQIDSVVGHAMWLRGDVRWNTDLRGRDYRWYLLTMKVLRTADMNKYMKMIITGTRAPEHVVKERLNICIYIRSFVISLRHSNNIIGINSHDIITTPTEKKVLIPEYQRKWNFLNFFRSR